jgi:integrase
MASLSERPGAGGTVSYTVRWREAGARQRRTFRRKKEAEAWQRRAADIEQAQRLGQPLASPTQALRRTLAQEWPRFLERREAEVAASTVDKHRWAYRGWIEPVLGHRKLGTITPEDLRGVLELARRAGKGVDTRIAIYQTVNMLLDNALGRDGHRCRVDVTVGTSTRSREINVLTDPELDRLIAATPARHRLLVDFLATMGARPHEALGLRGRDVDDGYVTLTSQKRNARGASGRRRLPLPTTLHAELGQHLAGRADDELVFGVTDWRNWRRRVFDPATEAAGLSDQVVPYDLRHTCASKLIRLGKPASFVAKWLGHSVRMTLEIYAHLFTGDLEDIARALDRPQHPTPSNECRRRNEDPDAPRL